MNNILALPTSINIFGLTIAYYAIFIISGILIAAYLSYREAGRYGIDQTHFIDGVLYGVILSILGTRLYYVIFNFDQFGFDIIKILGLDGGGLAGLAIHGGIITGFTFAFFYTRAKGMDRWKTFDIMVPAFLIAQVIGRWGNFFNQEAYGPDTTYAFLRYTLMLPEFIVKQMLIGGVYRHPTFLYESLWNLLGFILIIIIRRTKLLKVGDLIFIYGIWYGFGRFFIELLRQDPLTFKFFGMTIKQNVLISVVFFVVGILGLVIKRIYVKKPAYVEELTDKKLI